MSATISRGVTLLIMLLAAAVARGQSLVPLGERVEEPLLPTGISEQPVEMSAVLRSVWREADAGAVLHFIGDFELRMGRRRARAREAVVWLTVRDFERRRYSQYEIYLWRDATVAEPAGTTTSAPVLFLTLNSAGKLTLSSDRASDEPTADSPVYREALKLRDTLRSQAAATAPASAPKPVEVVGPGAAVTKPERARPPIGYRGENLVVADVEGRSVLTVTSVYVYQGAGDTEELVELRAKAAAIFFRSGAVAPPGEPAESTPEGERAPGLPLGGLGGEKGERGGLLPGGSVEGVYLEGDVVLTRGERMVRADRLYYDFEHDRALILDAVLRAAIPDSAAGGPAAVAGSAGGGKNIPLYVRADTIRQLSREQYVAEHARVTTSEFYTPHYHMGVDRVEVTDRTIRNEAGADVGLRAGTFAMSSASFNIGGLPILYWPYLRGDFKEGDSPLRSFRVGYSDRYGGEIESEWHLFNLFGLQSPLGFDAKLRLDYYTKRGPGVGINVDYKTDDSFGLFRGYYLNDRGEDHLGRFRDNDPDNDNRGRLTWRHRQFLPGDWEFTLEGSYISDRGFLEEYFRREFEEGKDQETLISVKKQQNTWAFTGIAQWRILDWYTQTERLPDFSFRVIAQPLGDAATWFSENRAGFVRYRPGEHELAEDLFIYGGREQGSGAVARVDSRQELDRPLRLGPFTLVPFGSIRGSAWDDSPQTSGGMAAAFGGHALGGGGVGRVLGTYGLRGSTYASRIVPDAESSLFDIHGVRHIIKPDVTAWLAHGSLDSDRLYPFDETVEAVDEIDGVSVGVRQRWQTKRGAADRRRIVDVFVLDLEAGAFNDVQPYKTTPRGRGLFDRKRGIRSFVDGAQSDETSYGFASWSRPENSIARNYFSALGQWRISDTTLLIAEANYDLNDRSLDTLNLSYAVQRTPRLSYLIGYRYIGEIDSNLIGAGLNYQISEKYTLAVREEFDVDRGETGAFNIALLRKLPRWYVAVTLDLDNTNDNVGVSLSAWPEGLPRATLGSRRFTGLAESTGIRPE